MATIVSAMIVDKTVTITKSAVDENATFVDGISALPVPLMVSTEK